MNSMTKDFTGTKLEDAQVKNTFESNAAPVARETEGPLFRGHPPRHGYWQDPYTGQEFSGGMEIAPTRPAR